MASPGPQFRASTEQHCREADDRSGVDLPREGGVGRAGYADGDTAWLQHAEGLLERLSAQAVQNHVVIAQNGLEVVPPVVDDDVSAQLPDPRGVGRARRRRDVCPQVLGELDRDRATPPEPAWTRTF